MRPLGASQTRSGMTLIELIVALTITGLALGTGYNAFATLADRRMVSDHEANAVARASAIRSTLIAWISGARLTIEQDDVVFRGVGGVYRSLGTDLPDADLTFFTSARTPVGNSGTLVHLFVDRDTTHERGLVAELSDRGARRHERIRIDSSVAGLGIEFLPTALSVRSWLPSWVSSTILPAGARVTLLPNSGDSLPPLLRLPITVSLDNGR